jgi:hypothetical protein
VRVHERVYVDVKVHVKVYVNLLVDALRARARDRDFRSACAVLVLGFHER